MLMKEADSRRKIGRTIGNGPARQLHSTILAEANRRKKLSANDKRAKVKAGGGIRPAILEVLLKSRKTLKRAEVAAMVAKRAPKGVDWSLGSCNLALAGLIKDRMIKKEETHGGKFSITHNGKNYFRQLRRAS
jgi:asparagine synthetase B (glutamine-hydrolysing)